MAPTTTTTTATMRPAAIPAASSSAAAGAAAETAAATADAASDAAAEAFAHSGALPLITTARPGAAGLLLARLDWALVAPFLACAIFLAQYILRDVPPYPRAVFAADRTIAMPVVPKQDQMPNYEAPLVPGLVLVAAAALAEFLPLLLARRYPASACERPPRGALAAAAFVRAVGGMLVALCATSAMTEFLKVFCGRPRPDYLSRCMPKVPATTEANAGQLLDSLVLSAGRGVVPVECTATDRNAVIESRKSFPSGHSSTACSAGLWGAMYVLHALRRYRGNGAAVPGAVAARAAAKAAARRAGGGVGNGGAEAGGGGAIGSGAIDGSGSGSGNAAASLSSAAAVPRWARELAASAALMLMLFFLAWPWGVGATRFVDNRHHPSDIVGGLLLGTMMTVPFFFRFEAVSDAWDARDARDPALLLPRPAQAAAAAPSLGVRNRARPAASSSAMV